MALDFRILEGIRGLAAFVVLLNHARGHLFVGGQAYLSTHREWTDWLLVTVLQVTSLGPQAVIVFFVLSGFSIAHSVERSASIGGFYLRRLLRLYPPYIAGLVLAWATYLLFPGSVSVFATPEATLLNLLYVPNGSFIQQYWSLTHEAIFYLIAPLVAAPRWRLPFAVVSALAFAFGFSSPPGSILPRFAFDYAVYFGVGVVAYQYRAKLHVLAVQRWALWWICAIACAIMVAALRVSPKVSFMIAAGFSLVLIANFLHHRITARWLVLLGAMSYTLYVTHFAAIYLWAFLLQAMGIQAVKSPSPWLWATAVPFALLVSWCFYAIAERPAMKLLERLRESRSTLVMAPR